MYCKGKGVLSWGQGGQAVHTRDRLAVVLGWGGQSASLTLGGSGPITEQLWTSAVGGVWGSKQEPGPPLHCPHQVPSRKTHGRSTAERGSAR